MWLHSHRRPLESLLFGHGRSIESLACQELLAVKALLEMSAFFQSIAQSSHCQLVQLVRIST